MGMTDEDEEFNRIEREAAMRKESVKATMTKRDWVGLTEQERNDIEDYCEMIIGKPAFDAIEAKLREKNI